MTAPESLFDILDEDEEERALREARLDVAAGRIVSHDEMVRWLESWGDEAELPCPVARAR